MTSTNAPSGVIATSPGRPGTAMLARRVRVAASSTATVPPSANGAQTWAPSGVIAIGADEVATRWVTVPAIAGVNVTGAVPAGEIEPEAQPRDAGGRDAAERERARVGRGRGRIDRDVADRARAGERPSAAVAPATPSAPSATT